MEAPRNGEKSLITSYLITSYQIIFIIFLVGGFQMFQPRLIKIPYGRMISNRQDGDLVATKGKQPPYFWPVLQAEIFGQMFFLLHRVIPYPFCPFYPFAKQTWSWKISHFIYSVFWSWQHMTILIFHREVPYLWNNTSPLRPWVATLDQWLLVDDFVVASWWSVLDFGGWWLANVFLVLDLWISLIDDWIWLVLVD